MLRKLLTIALPLLLPFLLYWAYLSLARRRTGVAGAPSRWQEAPWIWIGAAGVALMIASLAVFGMSGGVKPGTRLVPPMLIDGKIVPSHPADQ
jgi:Family of unknown function (DUF6111)